jgi:hypothetical protein
MPTILKDFFSEALRQPSDYVSYFVSARLAEMYPEAAILETESSEFDLAEYSEAGLCTLWRHELVLCQIKTLWDGVKHPLVQEIENGWFNVLWTKDGKNHFFDVVYVTWNDAGYETTRRWIIAESEVVAQNFLRAVCGYCAEVHGEILVFEGGHWDKDDKLFESIRSSTFDNLILPQALKDELREDFRRFFAAREMYRQYGVPWKRGVLLIGPPGNGKTHAIKALANELNLPCLYVKSFQSDRGSEQGNMRRVFERARRSAPCLVVLEDLDSMIEEENRAFLLNELDGFASNEGVAVIASTNHPEKLDMAILDRPSRFDRKYHFAAPGFAERLAYINHWNQTLQPEMRLTDAEAAAVAQWTDGFSFAYLKEAFFSSMMIWMGNQLAGAASHSSYKMNDVVRDRVALLREQMAERKEGALKASQAAA